MQSSEVTLGGFPEGTLLYHLEPPFLAIQKWQSSTGFNTYVTHT